MAGEKGCINELQRVIAIHCSHPQETEFWLMVCPIHARRVHILDEPHSIAAYGLVRMGINLADDL
jgi:hypothetical protein